MADDTAAELKIYLRRLGWGLATLAKSDREDIVNETREHLLDRVDQGATLGAVLAALGRPETYARRFLDEAEIVSALATQRPMTALGAIVRRVHRSATAGLAFVLVLVLFTFAGLSVVVCVMKLLDPSRVGLWISPGNFFFGRPDQPHGRELLGDWIYPLTIIAVAGAWFLGRLILFWALRDQRPRN